MPDTRQQLITRSMCNALEKLQTVRSHDWAGAYYAVLGGIRGLHPFRNEYHAALIEGRLLALQLFGRRLDP